MLRLVDDFLFVTTSRAAAEAIVQKMQDGFPEYGCCINPLKTRLNFNCTVRELSLARNVWRAKDGSEFIQWCGLLMNASSLELQADYTRYSGQHISTSLTMPRGRNAGESLVGD